VERDILSIVEAKKGSFSKGQRAIAKYIQTNYDKVAFMTAGKLGRTVGVSESTVVRFATEIGYDGYPEMRKGLQEMIKSRLTSVQRIEAAKDTMANHDILSSVLHTDINKIRHTLDTVDKRAFEAAVQAILGAKRIYIVAMRSSFALGSFMGFYFNLLFDNVKVLSSSSTSEMFEQLFKVEEDDVVIGISFPRYSSATPKAMKYSRDRGATVISITDSDSSPLVKYATINLFAKSDMLSFLDSLVPPLSLINALIVAAGSKADAKLSDTFTKLESIWEEYSTFDKTEEENQ